MKREKEVFITQDDIDKGLKLVPTFDPIALALKRTFSTDYACVSHNIGYIFKDSSFFQIKMPEHICRFITEYDLGLPVNPISFTAKLEEAVREGE